MDSSPGEPVTDLSDQVRMLIVESAREVGIEPITLVSGATHDASMMSEIAPAGMIFVPSTDGRSHCPEEHTNLEDIARGVDVLARSIHRLAAA